MLTYRQFLEFAEIMCLEHLNHRDGYTHNHTRRTALLSAKLLKLFLDELKLNNQEAYNNFRKELVEKYTMPLSPPTHTGNEQHAVKTNMQHVDFCETFILTLAGNLHDLGKIGWDDLLLKANKPVMKDQCEGCEYCSCYIHFHPEDGAAPLFKPLYRIFRTQPLEVKVTNMTWIILILFHHLEYGGNGYPKLEDIYDDDLKRFAMSFKKSVEVKKDPHLQDIDPLRRFTLSLSKNKAKVLYSQKILFTENFLVLGLI